MELELRLDEREQACVACQRDPVELRDGLREREVREVDRDDVDRLRDELRSKVRDIRSLQVDDARILSQRPEQLAEADVDRVDTPRTLVQEHLREPAGCGAEIERDRVAERRRERLDRRPELHLAAQRLLLDDRYGRVLGDERGGVPHGDPADRDAPAENRFLGVRDVRVSSAERVEQSHASLGHRASLTFQPERALRSLGMADGARWIDLLDPTEAEIRRSAPKQLRRAALDQLVRPAGAGGGARPVFQSHGTYVFGVLLVAVAVPEQDRVFYQEVDLVLTPDTVVTVRKTPPGESPFDPAPVHDVCAARDAVPAGMIVYHLVDEIAERYLDLLDNVNGEIDELEEHLDRWPPERTHNRLSELRHDLLHIRRTLAPTRDAVRGVADGRVDVQSRVLRVREVFPRDVELHFADVYGKLLRATEALELSRDLLAAVRDYQQAKIAHDQTEIVKRLTAIAALLLFPTFWVGVYGQNFEHMPELGWRLGYAFSWAVIVVVTIAQLVVFTRKRWL